MRYPYTFHEYIGEGEVFAQQNSGLRLLGNTSNQPLI